MLVAALLSSCLACHIHASLPKPMGKATVKCWGIGLGTCEGERLEGVTDAHSTRTAVVAYNRETGEGTCWGDAALASDCSRIDFQGVSRIASTAFAFVALNAKTGRGRCWGSRESEYPFVCSNINFIGVTDVVSTEVAFIAVDRNDGTGVCWGGSSGRRRLRTH